jgi:hypothetical protein
MRFAFAVGLPLLIAATPCRAPAQSALALEFGSVSAFSAATTQVGFRASPGRGERTGVDFAAATFPAALGEGFFLGMFDVDVTYGLSVDAQLLLFPRAGASFLFAVGDGGSGGGFGYNIGGGALLHISPSVGVRIDYTHRRFLGSSESLPVASISVGIVFIQ